MSAGFRTEYNILLDPYSYFSEGVTAQKMEEKKTLPRAMEKGALIQTDV